MIKLLILVLQISAPEKTFTVCSTCKVPAYYSTLSEAADLKKVEKFRESLFKILSQKHIQFKDAPDQLAEECPEKAALTEMKALSCEGQSNLNYEQAREQLFGVIHLEGTKETGFKIKDLYCLKDYTDADFVGKDSIGIKKIPFHEILNTEHVWPQGRFNKTQIPNLTTPGALDTIPKYSLTIQKTDLHHLYPSESKHNNWRGNLFYAEVDLKTAATFPCKENYRGQPLIPEKLTLTHNQRYYEPPKASRGNIARALFYFAVRYETEIEAIEEYYLRKWHAEDPVDTFEKNRNAQIYGLQKTRNPFIDQPQWVDLVEDF